MPHWEIIIFFLVISFVYSSVGFGGGSSYLAVLTFYALPFQEIKLTALVCNIIVVTGGTFLYIRHKQVDWKKVIPVVAVSVPLAFLGARLKLSEDTFFVILGLSLIFASILLWIKTQQLQQAVSTTLKSNYLRDGALGGSIGFLSGMVGIGGGIFLSPILNLMKWDTPKKIAATASFFILVNSISGIAGQLSAIPKDIHYTFIGLLAVSVLVGGQLGARLGINKFNPLAIRRVTAIVVVIAGIEVLHKHLHWFQ
jgi:uncharacterized membrane protein YfcA